MKMSIRSFSTRLFDMVKNLLNRFLFSLREIILFLHQIFYKGLSKKLENWPTFYTGSLSFRLRSIDLRCFLRRFVRYVHFNVTHLLRICSKSSLQSSGLTFSLGRTTTMTKIFLFQTLVDCKLSNPDFNKFLERCESKAACEGLTLEILLVLPMNRVKKPLCFFLNNSIIFSVLMFRFHITSLHQLIVCLIRLMGMSNEKNLNNQKRSSKNYLK